VRLTGCARAQAQPHPLPAQVLALFSKAMRKLYGHLRAVKEAAVERTLPKVRSWAVS